jgi:hypothetical protein
MTCRLYSMNLLSVLFVLLVSALTTATAEQITSDTMLITDNTVNPKMIVCCPSLIEGPGGTEVGGTGTNHIIFFQSQLLNGPNPVSSQEIYLMERGWDGDSAHPLISDILRFNASTISGPGPNDMVHSYIITLRSDEETLLSPDPNPLVDQPISIRETGDQQDITAILFPGIPKPEFSVVVQSDADVPEPSNWLLLGSALSVVACKYKLKFVSRAQRL